MFAISSPSAGARNAFALVGANLGLSLGQIVTAITSSGITFTPANLVLIMGQLQVLPGRSIALIQAGTLQITGGQIKVTVTTNRWQIMDGPTIRLTMGQLTIPEAVTLGVTLPTVPLTITPGQIVTFVSNKVDVTLGAGPTLHIAPGIINSHVDFVGDSRIPLHIPFKIGLAADPTHPKLFGPILHITPGAIDVVIESVNKLRILQGVGLTITMGQIITTVTIVPRPSTLPWHLPIKIGMTTGSKLAQLQNRGLTLTMGQLTVSVSSSGNQTAVLQGVTLSITRGQIIANVALQYSSRLPWRIPFELGKFSTNTKQTLLGASLTITPGTLTVTVATPSSASDDFNRANNSTTMGTNWTNRLNNMGLTSSVAYPATSAADCFASHNTSMSGDDFTVQARFNPSTTKPGWLCGGCNTSGEGAVLAITSSSISLNSMSSWDVLTPQSSASITITSGDIFKLERIGRVYNVYQNGTKAPVTWTDSSDLVPRNSSHRLVALGARNTTSFPTWDDFSAVG